MPAPSPAERRGARLGEYRACWDCFSPLPDAGPDQVFCASCARHRARPHAPTPIFTTEMASPKGKQTERTEPRAEFCHGAGPSGLEYRLLEEVPRPMTLQRHGAEKNPHYYMEAA